MQQIQALRNWRYIVQLCQQKKKRKRGEEQQNLTAGGRRPWGLSSRQHSWLCSASFGMSRKAGWSQNKAVTLWHQPHRNVMSNNRPARPLWRALMCETPIKRFARIDTKHFVFKSGFKFVLRNSINITKVGWRRRSGNQPILRKPTQTLQQMAPFAQPLCWVLVVGMHLQKQRSAVAAILYVVVQHTLFISKQPSCHGLKYGTCWIWQSYFVPWWSEKPIKMYSFSERY